MKKKKNREDGDVGDVQTLWLGFSEREQFEGSGKGSLLGCRGNFKSGDLDACRGPSGQR